MFTSYSIGSPARLDSSLRGRIGLLGRQLHEHPPPERRDGRIGGQNLVAVDVLDRLQLLRHGGGAGRTRRLHLGETRKIALDQASIGMHDDAALSIEKIGNAALADL